MSVGLLAETPHRTRPPEASDSTGAQRTAFVLSGGAALGALHVGMLRALYERGIVPDLLVGTSAGALNAGFIASRPQTVATADALAEIWLELDRDEVFPLSLRTALGGLIRQGDHLVPDSGLRALIDRHLEFPTLERAPIPLHLVAFDVIEGREVLLSSGPACEAVLAAAAIPGILPSVQWGDQQLIDGGVVNNTPISRAVELGAARVYVLPTQESLHPLGRPPQGALDAAIYGLTLLVERRLELDVARYAGEVELVVLPPANSLGVQATDFSHAAELISEAHAAAQEALAAVQSADLRVAG